MDENKEYSNNKGPWWKQGVQLFSEVSTWIGIPVILALVVGKWLDTHYSTKPILFLVSAGIGFIISSLGIFFVVRRYMQKIKNNGDFK